MLHVEARLAAAASLVLFCLSTGVVGAPIRELNDRLPRAPEPPAVWRGEPREAAPLSYAFPWLPPPDSGHDEIQLFAAGHEIVAFSTTVFDRDGNAVDTRNMAVLPGQAVSLDLADASRAAGDWMRISADGDLAGYCGLAGARGGRATMVLVPAITGGGIVVPVFHRDTRIVDGPTRNELALVNTGSDAGFRIVPRDSRGTDLSPHLAPRLAGELTLAAGARIDLGLGELLALGAPAVATVEIVSDGRLAGAIRVARVKDIATLPAVGSTHAIESGLLPFDRVEGDRGRLDFHLVNPNDEAAWVSVATLVDDDPLPTERTLELPGKTQIHGVVDERGLRLPWAGPQPAGPAPDAIQGVRLQASRPILAYALQGKPGGTFEGSIAAAASRRLALTRSTGIDGNRLLLDADAPGSATVRIYANSGSEASREDVSFERAGRQVVDLGMVDPGSFVAVAADVDLVGLLVQSGASGLIGLQPAADATPVEALPEGDALNAEPDPHAPTLPPAWQDWVEQHHRPLASLTADDLEDLHFLKEVLGDKRIVQLGESSHGTAEFSSAKVRLVRFLHQQMGFDVIAFESGTFECEWVRRMDPDLDMYSHMYSSIFGVWHSDETIELFEYIRRSKLTPRPLILTGFDPQNSAYLGGENQPQFLYDAIAPVDEVYAQVLFEADTEFRQNGWDAAYIAANKARLSALFSEALEFVGVHREPIAAARPEDPDLVGLLVAVLNNQVTRLDMQWIYLIQQNSLHYSIVRDRAMADNLDYLADVMYPDKKIITWAHNFHVRYDEPNVGNSSRIPSMGWHVKQRRGPEVYTVGLFMYRGEAAFNNRVPYTVRPPFGVASLEAIHHASGRKYEFIDMLHAPPVEGNTWMGVFMHTWSWGYFGPLRLVPRDNYDALLFIDRTRPPSYTH